MAQLGLNQNGGPNYIDEKPDGSLPSEIAENEFTGFLRI
jgi:hypothetical protein